MSRAEQHGWYRKPDPWTEDQMMDIHFRHGIGVIQRSQVVDGGIPTRGQLNVMLAPSSKTDVPRYWILELSKARDMLDEAEQLPDGSERLMALIDSASDTEERAIKSFLD